MARDFDPYKLSSPQVFLWRMIIFLVIAGFVAAILYRQIANAFMANPGLNGLIMGVLLLGSIMAMRQVIRLFPEIIWVNSFRLGDPGLEVRAAPKLLGPMAALLRDRAGRIELTTDVTRSILDSIGMRLDETRDITRYIGGLLVFLGLLGTFWGLTETVSSVGRSIQALNVGTGDLGSVFEDLKTGLAAPLGGMGTAFSSSLFGLAGSLVIGFLDLQATQAQNRFYNELEEWLSAVTQVDLAGDANAGALGSAESLRIAIDRLARGLTDNPQNRTQATAMASLAEGIQGLVAHMRSEQQMIRTWVEEQAREQRELRRVLDRLSAGGEAPQRRPSPFDRPIDRPGDRSGER